MLSFVISAFALAGTAVEAAVKHNDVILTLGLLSKQHVAHTPISHVSLVWMLNLKFNY